MADASFSGGYDPANPKVRGYDGAVMSYVEYLHELAN